MNRIKLLRKLQDREFRRAFAEEAVDVGVPIQIREMRRARGWTQQQLGAHADVAQESVARAESLSYGRFTLATLKNLAAAFDCALVVRFAPFSELLDWKSRIDEARVVPADYANDSALRRPDVASGADFRTSTDIPMPLAAPEIEANVRPSIVPVLKWKPPGADQSLLQNIARRADA